MRKPASAPLPDGIMQAVRRTKLFSVLQQDPTRALWEVSRIPERLQVLPHGLKLHPISAPAGRLHLLKSDQLGDANAAIQQVTNLRPQCGDNNTLSQLRLLATTPLINASAFIRFAALAYSL